MPAGENIPGDITVSFYLPIVCLNGDLITVLSILMSKSVAEEAIIYAAFGLNVEVKGPSSRVF